MQQNDCLLSIYEILNAHFGNLRWWPADSPFEVIIGAILTQNTAWRNVENVIIRLKKADLLSPEGIRKVEDHVLANLIKSSGYYLIKTKRIKSFIHFIYEEYGGDLDIMFAEDLWSLREKLLKVKGIGEETADSILLYAGNKPIFVVDTYTKRILMRHNLIHTDATYKEIQRLFMNHLPHSVPLFNQYHALLVNTGKNFCTVIPQCDGCPLHT
ncbi:MAG: endonuclease III domain-containing protein [Deltaproteobacteria bacterium]|nr:endonuclease III domain-containing protein [Deltaproteobacteria bacterium]